ncbi:MAG: acyl-CoA dehydrogenase family protein, partial [Patescibacteria group bacterium]
AKSLQRREEWAPEVERIWRDLRVARIFEGTSEILTLWSVARGLYPYLGLAARAASGGMVAKAKVGLALLLWHEKLRFSKKHDWKDIPPELRGHLDFAEAAARRFARQVIESCLKYQKKLQHKQLLLERMFWISARILTIALVVARASASGRKEEVALADAYARYARREIEKLFFEWTHNTDDVVRPLGEKILKGELSFLETGIT